MVVPALIKGGTVVTQNKADLDVMGRVIEAERINMIYGVPTVLYRILEMDLPARHDVSSLKTIRYGAASISPAKLEELLEVFGSIFVQGYGSTECWPSATILGRGDHRTDGEAWLKRLTSVGRPLPNQEVVIRDFEGNPLPAGEKGEIWIRGMNTIQAYYRDPELTRDNFTPDGFWKSGDIGAMDEDGYVYLIDRKKDLIITGGFNVYAAEVENCPQRTTPAVRNSAVVGLPHEGLGRGGERGGGVEKRLPMRSRGADRPLQGKHGPPQGAQACGHSPAASHQRGRQGPAQGGPQDADSNQRPDTPPCRG